LQNSAIILAGGPSKRFGKDKGLVKLKGKVLVRYLLEKVARIVDEKVIVVGSNAQKNTFSPLFEHVADVIVDKYDGHSPLIGALTGFETVQSDYSLLLPCDTPFLSAKIATLLLDVCMGRSATIPRWPNGWIEPLQAAYNTKSAIVATKKALNQGKRDMLSMINYLHGVRYISTLVLQELDPELFTFFNINTFEDLEKAESIKR
jgi:molybdopterin-guanine dinucleotide biosynthesis protein A